MDNTIQGKAFEFACLSALAETISAKNPALVPSIVEDSSYSVARSYFSALQQQNPAHAAELLSAGNRLAELLCLAEPKLTTHESAAPVISLSLQPDAAGMAGDVRDVVISKLSSASQVAWQIGISCKHNHDAVKHPRISPTIDFGAMWLGLPLADADFSQLGEIFAQVDADKSQGVVDWSQVSDKEARYYLPVLQLIMGKINSHPDKQALSAHLLRYLIGEQDFYKVIYSQNRTIHLQGFNFNGNLNRPADAVRPSLTVNRLHFPTRIVSLGLKPDSGNTIEIFFDKGWQVSMRVHSAATKIEKSLKMDVRLDGMPSELFSQSQDI